MCRIKMLFVMLVCPVLSLSAQSVDTSSGYPVVSLSDLFPLGGVLTSSEASARRTEMNAQTPSNSGMLSGNNENGVWNAKLSPKFQVMRSDHSTGSTWADAWISCKQYNGEGGSAGSWRLPTQRELQMIWVLHPQLNGKGGFTSFTNGYFWSSTEYSAYSAWVVDPNDGDVNNIGKTGSYRIRCIRDV